MEPKSHAKNLLVISSYPAPGKIHGRETVGIASYAKNTLKSLIGANSGLKITVLAERLLDAASNQYSEDSINVKRIWKRGSLSTFWNLISEIIKHHKNTKNILIELELAMFGGIINLLPLPLFLFILKLLGKKITVVMHQVIPDMNELSGHINREKNSTTIKIYNICIRLMYRLILNLTNQVIVFDQALKAKLTPFGNSKKIKVIPHGVEQFEDAVSKHTAREKLNIEEDRLIVLSFGYLAWYKGTDWLVDALSDNKTIQLILAGGPNLNHSNKNFYKKYILDIEEKCKKSGFLVTGFVPEDKISLYYQASDIVILPYRALMSASGPLSMALSYKKPFLVSKIMEGIFQTEDIKKLLFDLELNKEDLIFSDKENLVQKLEIMKKDPVKLAKIADLSTKLSKIRSWKLIGKMYLETLSNI